MNPEPQTPRERAVLLLRATFLPGGYPTPSQALVWAIRGAMVLVVLLLIASAVEKSLWAWLNLLIVPAVLAIGGYLFNSSQNRATEAAAERRAQDDALRSYLEQVGQLLLDKDTHPSNSQESDEVRTLVRAWTLALLPRLDGRRKRSVVQFLYESKLITKDHDVVDLTEAYLNNANLIDLNLTGAHLRGVSLVKANLNVAKLSEADLSGAILFGANLHWAKLDGADLSGAVLMSPDTGSTPVPRTPSSTMTYTFHGTGPKNADLSGADLSGANLTDAYVSEEQLRSAGSLEGATMPNGQKYKGQYRDSRRHEQLLTWLGSYDLEDRT